MPLASQGGVDIVPHHGGGACEPPTNDVPPHKVTPSTSTGRSTSSRNV